MRPHWTSSAAGLCLLVLALAAHLPTGARCAHTPPKVLSLAQPAQPARPSLSFLYCNPIRVPHHTPPPERVLPTKLYLCTSQTTPEPVFLLSKSSSHLRYPNRAAFGCIVPRHRDSPRHFKGQTRRPPLRRTHWLPRVKAKTPPPKAHRS